MDWASLQCHVRVFVPNLDPDAPPPESVDGLRCSRERGFISSFNKTENLALLEQRFCVAVVTSTKLAVPAYSIVCLDEFDDSLKFKSSTSDTLETAWHGRFTAVAVYLQILRHYLRLWHQKWTKTLDYIDNTAKIEVSSLVKSYGGPKLTQALNLTVNRHL